MSTLNCCDMDDCCNGDNGNGNGVCKECVCETVKSIFNIQSGITTGIGIGCVRELSPNTDTRPFVLFTNDGNLFAAYDVGRSKEPVSPVFRVESMDECCATLRILRIDKGSAPNSCGGSTVTRCIAEGLLFDLIKTTGPGSILLKTENYVHVNLCAFKAVQCLADVCLGIGECVPPNS